VGESREILPTDERRPVSLSYDKLWDTDRAGDGPGGYQILIDGSLPAGNMPAASLAIGDDSF
jgi:hypothetical protein